MRHWLIAPVVLVFSVLADSGEAQVIDWASVGIGGEAGNGDAGEEISVRAISADGRYVVFHSWADNLVAGDLNGFVDVFRHDRVTGTTVRVSVSDNGGDAAGESKNPSISADGRFVAFASTASDIVSGDGNSTWDVFVRNMDFGTTQRVSVSSTGSDPDGESNRPSISADGSLVVFSSVATNLVTGFATTIVDIYVRNLVAGKTTLVSIAQDGGSSEANSWRAKISPDGTTVSFASAANNLVPGDGGSVDVFLRNLALGQTTRISVNTVGGDPNNRSGPVSLSHDGRVAAFWSRASDLVPGDTNDQDDIFVWDADVGVLKRINIADDGSQAVGGGSWNTAVSGDGRFVVFMSDAENLVPEDSNGWGDIFAYDRQTETIEMLSFNRTRDQGDGFSRLPSITPDGNTVVFESSAGNFATGDNNGLLDIYVAHGPGTLFADGFESDDLSGKARTVP